MSWDDHERPSSTFTPLPDGSYLVAGRIAIEELNETLKWDLPRKDYDTVAGLIHCVARAFATASATRFSSCFCFAE